MESRVALIKNLWDHVTIERAKTVIFWYVVYHRAVQVWRHVRATGVSATVHETYLAIVKRLFAMAMLVPSARRKVRSELDKTTLDIKKQIAPTYEDMPQTNELPPKGLSFDQVSEALTKLSQLPNTKWESGRVSGAVYHGGQDMAACWQDAFAKFTVSSVSLAKFANPLHADVFPGVRQMEAEVVNMCLKLYNCPLPASVVDDNGGVGTTTSGGTESILMACKAYRDRAKAERGITSPEMIVPVSAHAAFAKAASYFKIKIHIVPVDPVTRKVNLKLVKRAINPNTILLVGSAPNFPDGIIDDIVGLSKLATRYKLGLHVDCCLGSFLMPFLERCGFPVDPFDFRVPGVTSISCDTHKYGFAPKGSSVIMYRSKSLRRYQYSVMTSWPGGVYATPSMAGSRPGAVIAGAWAAMQHMGIDGYTQSCREIVGAAKRIALSIHKDFNRDELTVLGEPLVSVVAFTSETLPIYEVGDRMSKAGWHLNALQNPPALHIACTRLTVPAVDDLLKDLRKAVDEVKLLDKPGDGSMVTLYGLGSSSAVGPGLVEEMASRYMDVLYA
ncbi:Dihydrosphingosine phosphate lyase [Microbotryomycetes sp. JL221]|nr:Dihydrosphingosine phosphate lyase [Microbotryomycetes sp. JL221]